MDLLLTLLLGRRYSRAGVRELRLMRNIYLWISIAVMAAALVMGAVLVWRSRVVAHAADRGDEVMVPKFEVDPFWPKPLPNHWILGMTVGVAVDARDNVWIVRIRLSNAPCFTAGFSGALDS
jgi:hypothetical protein